MIREFEASEFIAMIALTEKERGNNELRISFPDLVAEARNMERHHSNVRINLSSNSMQSFFCRVPKSIYLEQNHIIITNIEKEKLFLSHYISEATLVEFKA